MLTEICSLSIFNPAPALKEVPIKIAKDLTEDQKKEFIIKDNANFGEWDWDSLGNEWNTIDLTKWGIDVWQNSDDKNDLDAELEWTDMPEFENEDRSFRSLTIHFQNEETFNKFQEDIKTKIKDSSRYIWMPEKEKSKDSDFTWGDEK